MAIEQGDAYTYVGDEPIGIDANALAVNEVVKVREVVPAAEPGAHDDSEDAVVVEWESPALVHGEDGPEVGYVNRAMSVGVPFFNENFEPLEG